MIRHVRLKQQLVNIGQLEYHLALWKLQHNSDLTGTSPCLLLKRTGLNAALLSIQTQKGTVTCIFQRGGHVLRHQYSFLPRVLYTGHFSLKFFWQVCHAWSPHQTHLDCTDTFWPCMKSVEGVWVSPEIVKNFSSPRPLPLEREHISSGQWTPHQSFPQSIDIPSQWNPPVLSVPQCVVATLGSKTALKCAISDKEWMLCEPSHAVEIKKKNRKKNQGSFRPYSSAEQ